MKVRLAWVALLVANLLGGGCASSRIHVTPAVQQVTVPENNPTCYTLNDVRLFTSAPMPREWAERSFGARFARLAAERYPALFQRTAGAVPLSVQVSVRQEIDQGAALGVYICTLCIVGGIFPSVPWETEWQVSVQVSDARGALATVPVVKAVDRGWWTVLTPMGLMEIPGESDVPKVSAAMRCGPGQMPVEHATYTMQCALDQMVAELLKQPVGAMPARAPEMVPVTREPVQVMPPSADVPAY